METIKLTLSIQKFNMVTGFTQINSFSVFFVTQVVKKWFILIKNARWLLPLSSSFLTTRILEHTDLQSQFRFSYYPAVAKKRKNFGLQCIVIRNGHVFCKVN